MRSYEEREKLQSIARYYGEKGGNPIQINHQSVLNYIRVEKPNIVFMLESKYIKYKYCEN